MRLSIIFLELIILTAFSGCATDWYSELKKVDPDQRQPDQIFSFQSEDFVFFLEWEFCDELLVSISEKKFGGIDSSDAAFPTFREMIRHSTNKITIPSANISSTSSSIEGYIGYLVVFQALRKKRKIALWDRMKKVWVKDYKRGRYSGPLGFGQEYYFTLSDRKEILRMSGLIW